MKRIGIYFFCVVALGCITSSILYRKSEMADEIRFEKAIQNEATHTEQILGETIEVSDSSTSRAGFLVIEEDGYLVIYDKSAMKRYDETTILVANLPERLRMKVEEGMYFVTEEELYAFLENYSS